MVKACKKFSVKELFKRRKTGPRKKPVWIYLEQLMREMDASGIKPYNKKVGEWLRFLRDLKYFFHKEAKRKLQQLQKNVGPPWYFEFSPKQKVHLRELKDSISQDLHTDTQPRRTRITLKGIGILIRFPSSMLMESMSNAICDPGLFLWFLFTAYYGYEPSQLLQSYDYNSKIIMSAIAYVDYKETLQELKKLCRWSGGVPMEKQRTLFSKGKVWEPTGKLGPYLQKTHAPLVLSKTFYEGKPDPLPMTIKLMKPEAYEKQRIEDTDVAIHKRLKRVGTKVLDAVRTCNYRFWQPPISIKNTTDLNSYEAKLKMYRNSRARRTYLNAIPATSIAVPVVGGVVYSVGNKPFFTFSVAYVPSKCIKIHGGIVQIGTEYIMLILGYVSYQPDKQQCSDDCDCLHTWKNTAMKAVQDRVCKCYHNYDSNEEIEDGRCANIDSKYFHRSSAYGPFWFDHVKIFQPDESTTEDFIRDEVEYFLNIDCYNKNETPIIAGDLKCWEYLRAFFAMLSKTPLLIPHLPKAYFMKNLCEWARHRVYGKITHKQHKNMLLLSSRGWQTLEHIDFKTRAYSIPFTEQELQCLNFEHRPMIGKLSHKLFTDFLMRTRMRQIERSQLWFGTMFHNVYPSKQFTQTFFSYLPAVLQDINVLRPFKTFIGVGKPTCKPIEYERTVIT